MIIKILTFVYSFSVVTSLYLTYLMMLRIDEKAPKWYKEKSTYFNNIINSFIPFKNIKYVLGAFYLVTCSDEKFMSMFERMEEWNGYEKY